MLSTDQIVGFVSLGKREKQALSLSCENVQEVGGKYVVDGLDTICRKAWDGFAPCHVIAQLEEKGYLIDVGMALVDWSPRRVKRYQIVLNPGRVSVVEGPGSKTNFVLELEIGNKPNQTVYAFPIDSGFRLSISSNGLNLRIKAK